MKARPPPRGGGRAFILRSYAHPPLLHAAACMHNAEYMEPHNSGHAIAYVVLVVVGLVAGVFAAPYVNPGNSYKAGFNAAKELVQKSSIAPMLQDHGPTDMLSGQVTAINGTSFTMHVQSQDPFYDQSLLERTVATSQSTKVIVITQKDQKTFQSEMEAFSKTTSSNSAGAIATPPSPFTSTESSISSLAVGDFVVVTSSQDISKAKDVSASQVQIQSGNAKPAM